MSQQTLVLLNAQIESVLTDIEALEIQIANDPPATPEGLQALHDLQHAYRDLLDKLRITVAGFR